MVHFVGAGPGAADLITIRGKELIEKADVIIYAGSLVNPKLLDYAQKGCEIHDSSRLDLDEVINIILKAEQDSKTTVRLHTGDSSIYGATREQMDILKKKGIEYDTTPGVSSFCGAAAALNMEYTLPGISQSVIITRIDGRTGVPERESVEALSSHGATMVFFLSAGQTKRLSDRLISAGVSKDTPCALVYRATWPDEQKYVCTLEQLPQVAKEHNIDRQALIIVGQTVAQSGYELSKLYAPSFTTGYRKGKDVYEK